MKRKALRVRSEGSIHPYVTEAESREQHSDSPLCNSLYIRAIILDSITKVYKKSYNCKSPQRDLPQIVTRSSL